MLFRFLRKLFRRSSTVEGVVSQFNKQITALHNIHAEKQKEIQKHEDRITKAVQQKSKAHAEGTRALSVAGKIKTLVD